MSGPAPATLAVCASGCDFTSIQAAIDDVATVAGSTIDVVDSVHTEAGIVVDKDVTIRGQGAGLTIVQAHADAGSDAGRVFLIQPGMDVTIAGLTVLHGGATLAPEIRGLRRCGGGIVNQGRLTLDARRPGQHGQLWWGDLEPARDTIPAGSCHLSVDQRGVPRPQGTACDAGAFEQEVD